MSTIKVVSVALVLLLTAGGAVASTGGVPLATDASPAATAVPADVEADAAYDNGTVTVTVMNETAPLSNVTVIVETDETEHRVTTNANGTVTVDVGSAIDELEIAITADTFEGELEYRIAGDDLRLVEESYEYAVEDEADDEGEDESESETETESGSETETESDSESESETEDETESESETEAEDD